MSGLEGDDVLSAAALAEFHGVSTSYLLKHLQALSGAGLLETGPGPKRRLSACQETRRHQPSRYRAGCRRPQPAFRCAEIRQRGPNPLPSSYFTKPCGINAAMLKAERAYRAELAKTSMADILEGLAAEDDGGIAERGCLFLQIHQRAASARADDKTGVKIMQPRLNFFKAAPDAYQAALALENFVQSCGLEHRFIHLIKLRASIITAAPSAWTCM